MAVLANTSLLFNDFKRPVYKNNIFKKNIREEITKFSVKHTEKITTHQNELPSTLLEEKGPRRLKRFKPTDLTTRFS
jgi:hypothetical protein